jgi:hypothetical protein
MTTRTTRAIALLIAAALSIPMLLASSPSAWAGKLRFIDLDKVPKPSITGKEIVAGLEDFVTKFPMRQYGTPNNAAAADFLAKEAKKNGFKVRTLTLDGSFVPVDGTEQPVKVIEAVKKGTTKPDEWIAFVAHYDIVPGIGGATVQGAYDDGSGTNLLRYFGKAFSKIKTHRSIALIWFDAEEWGAVASDAYAAQLKEKGQKIEAVMGFDMNGIAYPANYCLCVWHGPQPSDAELGIPLLRYVNFDYLGFPETDGGSGSVEKWPNGTEEQSGVCVCGPNPRNSDEANFAEQGYFTLRWAGMKAAADYPGYHFPWDTIPFIEQVAGGRDVFEKGTENTFLSAYYTAMALDNL